MNCKQNTKLSQEQISILSDIKNIIESKELPDSYPAFMVQNLDDHTYTLRNIFIKHMAFVLLSKGWIKDLSHWIGKRNCLELMSGLGALSYGLRMQGVNIIATDDYSWKGSINGESSPLWDDNKMWTYVEKLDAVESVEKYGKNLDIIIMIWAPYSDEVTVKVLKKMRDVNPSCIMIYIGEEKGGCTAIDEFFDMFERIEDESFNVANMKFQNWALTKDQPFLIK